MTYYHGTFRSTNGDVWDISERKPGHLTSEGVRRSDSAICDFDLEGRFVPKTRERTPADAAYDLILDRLFSGTLTTGRKDDTGKDPWHLFPFDAARAIVKVLEFGAKKYAPRNWEKGMAWSRLYDACIRHLTAWFEGEKADPETGHSHLWHAGCCVLFLIAYEIRGVGADDRPKTDNHDECDDLP